jgi:hypothetical protein
VTPGGAEGGLIKVIHGISDSHRRMMTVLLEGHLEFDNTENSQYLIFTKDAKIKTNFITSVQAVDSAIAILPAEQRSKPEFVLQVITSLLDAANSEYGAAIANGKITAPIEYQDSRGFVVYSQELYKSISSQMTQEYPQAHKAIDTAFVELVKVWPTAIPPAQAVSTSEDVTKLVKTIEENTQKVREKTSTKAQS